MDIAQIRARDGNRCARDGSTLDLHVHHRIARSQGGRNYCEGLITLCAQCHRWVHGHPHEAREGGWLLRGDENPSAIPLQHFLWPGGPVWLGPELTFLLSDPGQHAA